MKIDLEAMGAEEREEVLTQCFRWARKNGGRLPSKAYREKVRTFPTPFVDLAVVFVPEIGSPEVLLELRPEKTHLYSGQWNIAGGNFQHRETLAEASARLAKDNGCSGTPIFAGVATYVKTREEVGMSFFYDPSRSGKAAIPQRRLEILPTE